jgi:hypothetical protein
MLTLLGHCADAIGEGRYGVEVGCQQVFTLLLCTVYSEATEDRSPASCVSVLSAELWSSQK